MAFASAHTKKLAVRRAAIPRPIWRADKRSINSSMQMSQVLSWRYDDKSVQDASLDVCQALSGACGSQRIDLIALSGGLDSSIIAALSKERWSPNAVAVIAADFVSTDLTYCQVASNEIRVPLSMCNVRTTEILDGIRETIRILGNFNDIEIRNSVVMYMTAKWAVGRGYRTIATGDGADELFAGYDFLMRTPKEQLAGEIERVCSVMHFPSHAIGEALGISVVSPFLDKKVTAVALGMHPALKIRERGDGDHTIYGKWILRKSFEKIIPPSIAWRAKSAMQDGSGTAGLTQLFDSIIGEEAYEAKRLKIKRDDGVIIRSRESMHYYEIFREIFGPPSETTDSGAAGGLDCDDADSKRRCPYCGFIVGDSRFCRMCAAFPI